MKYIIFYDSTCGFCNYWVGWIIEYDKMKQFYFVSLDSSLAKEFEIHFNYALPPQTLVLWISSNVFYVKSVAVLKILDQVAPNSLVAKVLKIIPRQIADIGYSIFAYFRRSLSITTCKVYTKEENKRFLSNNSLEEVINILHS